jgi:hypothetical protein
MKQMSSKLGVVCAALAVSLSLSLAGAVTVNWTFEGTNNSDKGGAPSGYAGYCCPYANTDGAMFIMLPGTAAGTPSGSAFEIVGNITVGNSWMYLGCNFGLIDSDLECDLSGSSQTLSFDAKLGTSGAWTHWNLAGNAVGGADPDGKFIGQELTTSWQHFSVPIDSAVFSANDPSGIHTTKFVFKGWNLPTGTGTVPVDLVIDNMVLSPGPAVIPGVPVVTGSDANYNLGSLTNDTGGVTHDGPGVWGTGAWSPWPGVGFADIGSGVTVVETSGSQTLGASGGTWQVIVDPILAGSSPANISSCNTLLVRGRKTNGDANPWKVRIEDSTKGTPYLTVNLDINFTTTMADYVFPLSSFTTGTPPVLDPTKATNVVLATNPVADGPLGLQVQRIRLYNNAGVNDWSLY